jgi:hypothetical protein
LVVLEGLWRFRSGSVAEPGLLDQPGGELEGEGQAAWANVNAPTKVGGSKKDGKKCRAKKSRGKKSYGKKAHR